MNIEILAMVLEASYKHTAWWNKKVVSINIKYKIKQYDISVQCLDYHNANIYLLWTVKPIVTVWVFLH